MAMPRWSTRASTMPKRTSFGDGLSMKKAIDASPRIVTAGAACAIRYATPGGGVKPSVGSSVRKNMGAHETRGVKKEVFSFQ